MSREDTGKLVGKLAPADAGRDAIHIAVAPVVAAEMVYPGQHVGLNAAGEADGTSGRVGVVDPFYTDRVFKGERFWLYLYPGSITSLRHVWTHAAFTDQGAPQTVAKPGPDKAISESWLRQYAMRVNSYFDGDKAYETLMDDIRSGGITYHGTDMHSRSELKDEDELAYHASIVLGKPVNFGEFEFFSCTC